MLTKEEKKEFIKFATANRDAIMKDSICGCYYCKEIFSPKEITQWVHDQQGDTAICPYCSIDSVIGESCGYEISKELLEELHEFWFKPHNS